MSAEYAEVSGVGQHEDDPTFEREYHALKFAREEDFIREQWNYIRSLGRVPEVSLEEALQMNTQVRYEDTTTSLSVVAEVALKRGRQAARFAEILNRSCVPAYELWLSKHQNEIETDFGAIVQDSAEVQLLELRQEDMEQAA